MKNQCPHCGGKISIFRKLFYLEGRYAKECPHCKKKIKLQTLGAFPTSIVVVFLLCISFDVFALAFAIALVAFMLAASVLSPIIAVEEEELYPRKLIAIFCDLVFAITVAALVVFARNAYLENINDLEPRSFAFAMLIPLLYGILLVPSELVFSSDVWYFLSEKAKTRVSKILHATTLVTSAAIILGTVFSGESFIEKSNVYIILICILLVLKFITVVYDYVKNKPQSEEK